MNLTHKQTIACMYVFLIVCFTAGIAYNYGYNKAYKSKSRPVYIKYSNSINKNLTFSLKEAGINADPSQIDSFANIIKDGSKHAR